VSASLQLDPTHFLTFRNLVTAPGLFELFNNFICGNLSHAWLVTFRSVDNMIQAKVSYRSLRLHAASRDFHVRHTAADAVRCDHFVLA
jgi:hypothetical protein